MFGYVRVNAAELRLREYECYRALYCGLCKTMGKCTGQCSRLSLSYDFAFLAAIRMALIGEQVKVERIRCLLHPFKKKQAVLRSETLAYCAHASALLTYHKLQDDKNDEKGLKKARAVLSVPLFKKAYQKARRKYPDLDRKIATELSTLSEIERDPNAIPSADEPAACFGRLMEAVVSEGLEGTNARIAKSLGRAVGHWIYLIDAADDYTEDCKTDRFNPYRRIFREGINEEQWQSLQDSFKLILSEAERAHGLMDAHPQDEINEIISNILYLGMPATAERVVRKNTKSPEKANLN